MSTSNAFSAPPSGKPFMIELAQSKKTIPVAEHQSVLEAVEAAGVDAPYLCRGGACGQCETTVLSCDGSIRFTTTTTCPMKRRQSDKKMMICVTRIEGAGVVLDL